MKQHPYCGNRRFGFIYRTPVILSIRLIGTINLESKPVEDCGLEA